MRPAWPAILLTTLAGTGQGLFLALAWVAFLGPAPKMFFVGGSALSLAFLGAGLAAARWHSSPLPREAVALPALMAVVGVFGAAHLAGVTRTGALWIAGVGVAMCLVLFAGVAMILARTAFLREWHSALAPVHFALLGTASGFSLAVALAVLAHPRFAGPLALAAFSIGAAAWAARSLSLILRARRLPRERALRGARWAFVLLLFPVPGWLQGWGGGTLAAYVAAFLLQYAGLLAERWHFLAEARPARMPGTEPIA